MCNYFLLGGGVARIVMDWFVREETEFIIPYVTARGYSTSLVKSGIRISKGEREFDVLFRGREVIIDGESRAYLTYEAVEAALRKKIKSRAD